MILFNVEAILASSTSKFGIWNTTSRWRRSQFINWINQLHFFDPLHCFRRELRTSTYFGLEPYLPRSKCCCKGIFSGWANLNHRISNITAGTGPRWTKYAVRDRRQSALSHVTTTGLTQEITTPGTTCQNYGRSSCNEATWSSNSPQRMPCRVAKHLETCCRQACKIASWKCWMWPDIILSMERPGRSQQPSEESHVQPMRVADATKRSMGPWIRPDKPDTASQCGRVRKPHRGKDHIHAVQKISQEEWNGCSWFR